MTASERLAHAIDHTILKPDATPLMIRNLCDEAIRYGFTSVCINPCYVELATSLLSNSSVKICTVIGFPLGASVTRIKVLEATNAIVNGAQEIDVVLSIGLLTAGDYKAVIDDLATVISVSAAKKVVSKVIIETCLLNREQKINACNIVTEVGADFIKTSTGFSSGGATLEDVKLLREKVGSKVRVKASGGIRDAAFALALMDAGAERIGTSNGVKMMNELRERGE